MKSITALLLLVASSLAIAIGPGFLTQKKRDWSFIQSVGGMSVASHEQNLIIEVGEETTNHNTKLFLCVIIAETKAASG